MKTKCLGNKFDLAFLFAFCELMVSGVAFDIIEAVWVYLELIIDLKICFE